MISKKFTLHHILLIGLLHNSFDPGLAQTSVQPYDSTIVGINTSILEQHQSTRSKLTGNIIFSEENKANKPVLLPSFQYEYKLAELNATTPVELEYNEEVLRFIELYLTRRWKELPEIIGLSSYYFPIFEEVLSKYNLPLELKYLVFVESGFDPLAVSSSGAVGLWQFKHNSGKMFDLAIDSYIDERRDPFQSSEAACKYFNYLYNTFNDWQLAIAAFNGGPGEIRNAIQQSGGKTNFWDLTPYLAEQTKNYLPAYIAAVYIFNNYSEHGLYPIKPLYQALETEPVTIHQEVTFHQISEAVNISVDTLQWLNPKYKRKVIPESPEGMELILPISLIPAFIASENKIYGTPLIKEDYHDVLEKGMRTTNKEMVYHVVEKGEFFHLIAMKYNCTIENIKAWNNLESNFLYPGQRLIIWVDKND